MTGFLLDTNVISEVIRETPDQRVTAFLAGRDDVWVSTVVIHEVSYGLNLLPMGNRRNRLSALHEGILSMYAHRILPLDRLGAEWAAEFRANARRAGRPVEISDALVAGIARANGLIVATRDVGDFSGLGLEIFNPWDSP